MPVRPDSMRRFDNALATVDRLGAQCCSAPRNATLQDAFNTAYAETLARARAVLICPDKPSDTKD